MAGVYSERFILANGTGVFQYAVPIGKRAIVKSASVYNGENVARIASLVVAGQGVWSRLVPGNTVGSNPSLSFDGMLVLYSGEILGLYLEGAYMAGTASGYLLATG